MGKRYDALNEDLAAFIRKQKIYFVATAASEGRVNLSPKGMDTLKVLDRNRALWLNLTGSGNETAAHVRENPRMTILFCS
ncbi:MAG: pyridoxamine 5'-phosphate oxidase family protein, partial [Burkholderiales bacterium]|nr:pyridoxamine 5'-phosphate oxidase family protein [Burkholderiales bacterium]